MLIDNTHNPRMPLCQFPTMLKKSTKYISFWQYRRCSLHPSPTHRERRRCLVKSGSHNYFAFVADISLKGGGSIHRELWLPNSCERRPYCCFPARHCVQKVRASTGSKSAFSTGHHIKLIVRMPQECPLRRNETKKRSCLKALQCAVSHNTTRVPKIKRRIVKPLYARVSKLLTSPRYAGAASLRVHCPTATEDPSRSTNNTFACVWNIE